MAGIGGGGPASSYVPQSSQRIEGDRGRDRGARRDALGPASITAPAPVPPSTGGTPGEQDDDEGSPTEDQYADTLARLGNDLY